MTYNEARFSNLSIPEKAQITKIIGKEKRKVSPQEWPKF